MASGIFAILDDIALLLDDTAAMSKLAAKKTAGLLGDDLAVNAEQATGFHASRELPVIWAISKGSLVNKAIILPVAFLLSAYMPWLIVPILLLGGAYLSFEGTEKVFEWFVGHHPGEVAAQHTEDGRQIVEQEQVKIKGAVRTDFILSIEIVVVSLETVIGQPFVMQVMVVGLVALLATVGVYGLVAFLVRIDDMGLFLIQRAAALQGVTARAMRRSGEVMMAALPRVIRLLGVVGTLAMLLVGGGMFLHNVAWVHHLLEALPVMAAELIVGLVVGSVLLGGIHLGQRVHAKLTTER